MSLSSIALFCCLADFAKSYQDWERHRLIPMPGQRRRSGKLDLGEMLFIMTLFHLSEFKNFKAFWRYGIEQKYRDCFGDLPSYERFVSLMPRLFIPFCVLIHSLRGQKTGIYIADSSKLAVCHNLRISRNKVFKGLAARGKTSTGWFYGFKLHLVINHKGEIMAVKITPGNIDDRAPLDVMTKGLKGKLFLRKRFIIETLLNTLKSGMGLEHTRHRSPTNAFVHILSCLPAYMLEKKKVKMKDIAYP